MCSLKYDSAWDETLEVTLPLAGPAVAFIGMFIALMVVVS